MYVIGIAGGTCSGKSTLAEKLKDRFGERCTLIHMDSYYRHPFSTTVAPVSGKVYVEHNHPSVLELDRMYDDVESAVKSDVDVVMVEGLFALEQERLRDLCDFKIFVDLDSDERLVRRIRRFSEFGQSFDEITDRYIDTVKFRHAEFVEPSRWHADMVVNGNASDLPVDIIETYVRKIID